MQKSKLTLYIFVALVLGVVTGYMYNLQVIDAINIKINAGGVSIKHIDHQLAQIKDSTSNSYNALKLQRTVQSKANQTALTNRDDKLVFFTILSDIFLRLIKMIVAPLVFTTLVVGVAKVGDIKAVGRIGGRTMLWFISATLVSLLLGMLLVNLFQPGTAMHLPLPDSSSGSEIKKSALSVRDFVGHVFPRSFFEAMTNNEILQIVVFALFFGIGTAAIGKKGEVIIVFLESVSLVILKITGYVMKFAPFAVFGAITAVVARQGLGILSTYSVFIGEFYVSLIILWLLIILAGYFVLGNRALSLVNNIKDAMLLAFSTSTSEAAYPRVLVELERFGCKENVVSFVLPLGYSFNLDGSMMYMTFASLFLAQAYSIHLGFVQQLTMLLVLMLTSKGVAGVPRASLVVIAGTIGMFNIPEAGLFLLIGIDPLLDMGRSATNVLGNAMATAVVNKWEGGVSDFGMIISDVEI
jgi:Na+/H+-dicarboxylate symporter